MKVKTLQGVKFDKSSKKKSLRPTQVLFLKITKKHTWIY